MARRGPKKRTARNSRAGPGGGAGSSLDWSAPPYLSEVARSEHERLVALLGDRGVLDKTDPRLVELYAVTYDLLKKSYAKVEKDGPTVESDRGNVSEHPSVQTMNSCTIRLKSIMNDLGLTPASSRHAVATNGIEKEADPIRKYIKIA